MGRIIKIVVGAVGIVFLVPISVTTHYRIVRGYTLSDSMNSGLLGWTTDTSWAKEYSEQKFAKVTVGMTREEVRNIMGDPPCNPNPDYWGYTWSPSGTHYHQRGFVFSVSGRVTEIVKGFYFD